KTNRMQRPIPSHEDLHERAVCLLLRLGEGRLATFLWCQQHPPRQEGSDDRIPEVFREAASNWLGSLGDQAVEAHARADDALALHALRRLKSAAGPVEAEARRRNKPGRDAGQRLFFLETAEALLRDQERRAATTPPDPFVCVGPGRHPDQARRVAALVA